MQITITMSNEGRFDVNLSEGTPMFVALGALEVAKNMLINQDVASDDETEGVQ